MYAVWASVYVSCVMCSDACPIRYCLIFGGMPASSSRVAYVCRKMCGVTVNPSFCDTRWNARRTVLYDTEKILSVLICASAL